MMNCLNYETSFDFLFEYYKICISEFNLKSDCLLDLTKGLDSYEKSQFNVCF